VFAARIADDIKGLIPAPPPHEWGRNAGENDDLVTLEDSPQLQSLRRLMSDHAGVIRNRDGLEYLMREIASLERANTRIRFSNIATAARLIAAAAWQRQESRGGHFRSDFPQASEAWKHRTFLTLDDAQAIFDEVTA
jgi:L-aspartate oxidase